MDENGVLTIVVADLSAGHLYPHQQPPNRECESGDQQPSENACHPVFWCCFRLKELTIPSDGLLRRGIASLFIFNKLIEREF
jgi:hypothetical protein